MKIHATLSDDDKMFVSHATDEVKSEDGFIPIDEGEGLEVQRSRAIAMTSDHKVRVKGQLLSIVEVRKMKRRLLS